MKFKIYPQSLAGKTFDSEYASSELDLGSKLLADRRITKVREVCFRYTNHEMPWVVHHLTHTIAEVYGRKCLVTKATQNGQGSEKGSYDLFYCGNHAMRAISDFCEKHNLGWFVYGHLHDGSITLGHNPFDLDSFLKKYISLKLGDESKGYLTWTVFHEILGNEHSLFK